MNLVSGFSFVGTELFLVTYFVIKFTFKKNVMSLEAPINSSHLETHSVEEHVVLLSN